MKRTIVALAALLLSSSVFSAANGITLTCDPELPTFGTPNVEDVFYMWLTNTTGITQKVHVRLFQGLDDNRQVTSKEYDVNVHPGFYTMPPDFTHIRMTKKAPGLYRNIMTMDVTGYFTMHASRTCYVRVVK